MKKYNFVFIVLTLFLITSCRPQSAQAPAEATPEILVGESNTPNENGVETTQIPATSIFHLNWPNHGVDTK